MLADRPELRVLVQRHEATVGVSATGRCVSEVAAPCVDGIAGGQAQLDGHYPRDQGNAVVQERRADRL